MGVGTKPTLGGEEYPDPGFRGKGLLRSPNTQGFENFHAPCLLPEIRLTKAAGRPSINSDEKPRD
jgi:hypothetical protein